MNQSRRLVRAGMGGDRVRIGPQGLEAALPLFKLLGKGILSDAAKNRYALSPSERRRLKDQKALVRRLKLESDKRRRLKNELHRRNSKSS